LIPITARLLCSPTPAMTRFAHDFVGSLAPMTMGWRGSDLRVNASLQWQGHRLRVIATLQDRTTKIVVDAFKQEFPADHSPTAAARAVAIRFAHYCG
jgi:hypothetical protein